MRRPGGRPASSLKLNAIVDRPVIEALYRASNAGVDIDLIVRGACSLQPGSPGISERIRVRSIVGEFLEHSRIWGFENGGDREWYIGSADLMDRNLDRRVEAVVPVEDTEAEGRIAEIIELMLGDDRRSWQLQPDARWVRTEAIEGRPGTIDTFEVLKERALESGPLASVPRRPGCRGRLAGPAGVSDEVELKYRVSDLAAGERLLAADHARAVHRSAGGARAVQLEDRYVDTADGALAPGGVRGPAPAAGRETIVR